MTPQAAEPDFILFTRRSVVAALHVCRGHTRRDNEHISAYIRIFAQSLTSHCGTVWSENDQFRPLALRRIAKNGVAATPSVSRLIRRHLDGPGKQHRLRYDTIDFQIMQ